MKNKARILAGLGQPKFTLPPEPEEFDDMPMPDEDPEWLDSVSESAATKPDRSAIIKAALHKAKQGGNSHEN